MDAIYGYQSLKVEAQQRNAGSLLQWTRRMIEIRKRHPVFGAGVYEDLTSSNPSVLAFVRLPASEDPDHRRLGPHPVREQSARFPQPVELDLRRFIGVTPVECMGAVVFPKIGKLSYLLTLPGHGFYWFQCPPRAMAALTINAALETPGPAKTAALIIRAVVNVLDRHRTEAETDGRPTARH